MPSKKSDKGQIGNENVDVEVTNPTKEAKKVKKARSKKLRKLLAAKPTVTVAATSNLERAREITKQKVERVRNLSNICSCEYKELITRFDE